MRGALQHAPPRVRVLERIANCVCSGVSAGTGRRELHTLRVATAGCSRVLQPSGARCTARRPPHVATRRDVAALAWAAWRASPASHGCEAADRTAEGGRGGACTAAITPRRAAGRTRASSDHGTASHARRAARSVQHAARTSCAVRHAACHVACGAPCGMRRGRRRRGGARRAHSAARGRRRTGSSRSSGRPRRCATPRTSCTPPPIRIPCEYRAPQSIRREHPPACAAPQSDARECAADRAAAWTCAMQHGTRRDCSARPRSTLRVPCCARVLGVRPSVAGGKMRAAFGEAAVRWRSEASVARPIPRASTHVPLVSVSAAACQAAPLSTAADRRSGGSPGSQVVDRDSVLYHSIRSVQPNPPAERAATLCGPLGLARRRLMASIAMRRRIRVGRRRPSRSAWKRERHRALAHHNRRPSNRPARLKLAEWARALHGAFREREDK